MFLVDTLGELQMFYAAADVAFVGGSLVPVGGHNLLEPAVLGLPMLSGPHTQNAQDVAELLQECGALRIVTQQGGARAAGQRMVRRPGARARRGRAGTAGRRAEPRRGGPARRDGRAAAQPAGGGEGGWDGGSAVGVVRNALIDARSAGARTPDADFSRTRLIR